MRQTGDTAPDFTAMDSDGHVVNLAALLKKGPTIIAFFPKAFTPGCTKELKAYSADDAIQAHTAQVIAISTDDATAMKKFKSAVGATYPLVPDPEGILVRLFGVKMPLINVAKRVTFVIGTNGKIEKVYSGDEAVDPNAAIAACALGGKAN